MAYQAVDEIMARCEKDGVEFWKAVQLEDCEENGISEEESWNQMTHMWNSMKESVAAYEPRGNFQKWTCRKRRKADGCISGAGKTVVRRFCIKGYCKCIKNGM